jgi:hypothetical protein
MRGIAMSANWSDFWKRHGQRNYTPTFNGHLDSLIEDPTATVAERVDAWILRTSWGNWSDCCVDGNGSALVQSDCARRLKLDRRQVNPVFKDRESRGYIRFAGREIHPLDDPAGTEPDLDATFADSSPNVDTFRTLSEEEAKPMSFGAWVSSTWADQHPDDYKEYQRVERQWKSFRTRMLNDWRAAQRMSEGSMTSEAECPKDMGQNVGEVDDKVSEGSGTIASPSLIQTVNSKPSVSSSSSVSEQRVTTTTTNQPPVNEAEAKRIVGAALTRHGNPDPGFVAELLTRCRAVRPDSTPEEIAGAIQAVAPARRERSHLGFFLTAVPNALAAPRHVPLPAPQAAADDPALLRWRKEQEAALSDPNVSEQEKRTIRQCLGLDDSPRAMAQKAGEDNA